MSVDWQLIANISTTIAVLIAIGVFIWQINANIGEKKYAKSRFALQSALESYEQAIELLTDNNNDRVTWITAARIIERANRISNNITEEVHVDVFEIQHEKYRRQAAEILGYENPNKGAWFFYGSSNFTSDVAEAAKEATRSVNHLGKTRPRMKYLSEDSLSTVYNLASYPGNYEDPLVKDTFVGKKGIEMLISFPGLYEYIEHRNAYVTVAGKLIKRDKSTESTSID